MKKSTLITQKTMKWLICLVCVMTGSSLTTPSAFGKEIIGYIQGHLIKSHPHIEYHLTTRVVVWALSVNADGSLNGESLNSSEISALASLGVPRSKMIVGVAGPAANFSRLSADPRRRQNLANRLRDYCNWNGIGGVTLNWEHPRNSTEANNYARVFQTLRRTMGSSKFISAAVDGVRQTIASFGFRYMNTIEVMCYNGYNNMRTYMNNWARFGVPNSKLVALIGYFSQRGRNYTSYARIIDTYNPAPNVNAVGGHNFVGQDGVRYAMNTYGGGTGAWVLTDDKIAHPRSLLAAR